MNVTDGYIERMARLAETAIPAYPGDYRVDGILHCIKCKTPKEMLIETNGKQMKVRKLCECEEQKELAEKEAFQQDQENRRISELRIAGLNESMRAWTFENSNNSNPDIKDRAVKFVDRFDKMREAGVGFLFYGDVGTGKSYMAACIANALIDKGVPVLVTNFSRLLNDLSGFSVDHNAYISNLNRHPLLIIDDLGIERSTEYALEKVFDIIDSRYRDGKPLIVTTNLTMKQLSEPEDVSKKRIYDRILEMCLPVPFRGVNQREQKAQEKLAKAKELFA